MATFTATCHTPDNNDADRRIQGIGGGTLLGGWWHTVDQVINNCWNGHEYYVGEGLLRVQIRPHKHPRSGRWYIKTDADGIEPNNILSLPPCPR